VPRFAHFGTGREQLGKGAFPASRIVAIPIFARRCPIQDGHDTTAHATGGLGLCLPDRLQHPNDQARSIFATGPSPGIGTAGLKGRHPLRRLSVEQSGFLPISVFRQVAHRSQPCPRCFSKAAVALGRLGIRRPAPRERFSPASGPRKAVSDIGCSRPWSGGAGFFAAPFSSQPLPLVWDS
jgi:hypothetical protein